MSCRFCVCFPSYCIPEHFLRNFFVIFLSSLLRSSQSSSPSRVRGQQWGWILYCLCLQLGFLASLTRGDGCFLSFMAAVFLYVGYVGYGASHELKRTLIVAPPAGENGHTHTCRVCLGFFFWLKPWRMWRLRRLLTSRGGFHVNGITVCPRTATDGEHRWTFRSDASDSAWRECRHPCSRGPHSIGSLSVSRHRCFFPKIPQESPLGGLTDASPYPKTLTVLAVISKRNSERPPCDTLTICPYYTTASPLCYEPASDPRKDEALSGNTYFINGELIMWPLLRNHCHILTYTENHLREISIQYQSTVCTRQAAYKGEW